MGRGLHPRVFSAYTGAGKQMRVSSCWIPGEGSANTTSYIVRQTGESTFVVKNSATGVSGAVRLKTSVVAAGDAVINVNPLAAGTGATATVRMRAKSAVPANAGGTGYAVNDTITLAGGTSTTAAILTVTSVSGGKVTGVSVQTAGSYSVLPAATTTQASSSGAGTGATFTVTWEILSYTVGAGGSSYVNAVADHSADGGATATVTVAGGAVTAITPVDRGAFSAIPTVSIVGSATAEQAKRFSAHKVITFSGNAYVWNEDGTTTVAGQAELPLS